MKTKKGSISILFLFLVLVLCGLIIYFLYFKYSNDFVYDSSSEITIESIENISNKIDEEIQIPIEPIIIPISHIETPSIVKAIYLSGWVAGSEKIRAKAIKLIDDTELNAVVIDIKDSTGRISFNIPNIDIQKMGSIKRKISDIRKLTNLLHKKNIYIIGRIAVFQDPYLAELKPEWAITKKSDGGIWKDRKGLAFLNPTKIEVHKYILDIALGSYDDGFDEINLDYIRYPSDGNISDINYNLKEGQTRSDNIENFFKYISTGIKKDINIPISADLFGLTTEATGDMGIGQVWEKALPYFDFLAPMVYPSHYASSYAGYKNPGEYPYEVIYKSILSAINKTKTLNQNIEKIRPWLQDFDLGAVYTPAMVKAQFRALNDLGLYSWMLWDPTNKYTPDALKLENNL